MRILCTNDDGIHAPGLKTLEAIARSLSDDVWVVAPETDQSGVAHSLSLNDPLAPARDLRPAFRRQGHADRLRDHGRAPPHAARPGPTSFSPASIAGQNVAEDVTYSGTVAGAIEGTILGIPSIALSQAYGPDDAQRAALAMRRASRPRSDRARSSRPGSTRASSST